MPVQKETGSVSIDAQNIMPVIKRWLYSDKDIFLREVASNACDAITKFRIANPSADEEMRIDIRVDQKNRTLTISDTGIGMTADEVRRYINQVAFSSAAEFMKNYTEKPDEQGDIIGHFGLGFYSVFMVSERVEIQSLSWEDGAEPVHWESTDGMAFELGEGSRTAHGTDIILHISEEEKEFLELYRVREVLNRYCAFMTAPIYLEDVNAAPVEREIEIPGETNEDGTPKKEKRSEKPAPQLINETKPLWLKKPADCTEQEYKDFYHKLFGYDEPLFWVHLNVDYPFNLKGILYFPKLSNDFGTHEGQIKLFSGQVFVADNIKEIIPEFLMLLKGVIDCPDIPLNVSRSFLQNDREVKKISGHITKKVADRLTGMFNTERSTYEGYWDDIAPFIKFGCIRERKFYEAMKDALLFKTTKGEYLTLAEYKTRNTEKTGKKVYYTNDPERQAASVGLYTQRGIDVAVMNTIIDNSFLSFLEYSDFSGEEPETTFARVDADVSGLTEESDDGKDLDPEALQALFRKALGQEKLEVKLESLADADLAAVVTEEEQSRRFKEMSRLYGNQPFSTPDQYTLVLNRRSQTIQALASKDPEDEKTRLLCAQVYDLARMAAQPLENQEITEFLNRSQKLLAMLTKD